MGQTLTHGIYLPDEGERNCYTGLAANWQILDTSVGTVAEHTVALAGKAPAVHTHTKADITDFPAYGNAAGTICEGNDSRLSDARTPVAHTHGKTDITDLFNSANTWSGDNSYSKAITVAKNSDTNFFFNAKHTAAELGSLPSSDQVLTLAFKDKNDDNLCYARVYYETTGGNSFRIFVRNKYTSGAPSTSGTADYAYFGLRINADRSKEAVFRASLRPYDSTNAYNLGDSTYKWKTLNGINPGALSLPDISDADPIYTNNWVGDNSSSNQYTPTENGWIYFRVEGANKNITIRYGGAGGDAPSITSESTLSHVSVFFPVRSGVTMYIFFNGTMVKAFFYPCLGNV